MFMASSECIDAADAQAKARGIDAARVFVPHPIQDRTDEEMEALADQVIDEVVAAITR